MLSVLTDLDKVSIVAIGKMIEKSAETSTIAGIASKLTIPLMTESRNRVELLNRISAVPPLQEKASNQATTNEIAKNLVSVLLDQSGALKQGVSRKSYSPWFKEVICSLRNDGASLAELAELTKISKDSLSKFAADESLKPKFEVSQAHEQICDIWKNAPPEVKNNLDSFWGFLGRKHSEKTFSYKEVRQILIDLGFRYPRGPSIADKGTQVKKKFDPHALWEGDGKEVKIVINGILHKFLWYAFVDQSTTLLVGASITGTESSKSFLDALKDGSETVGFAPVGILIDNRLSGNDMSPINDFCLEHQITLVRTFPGNSKSNGNIENNFSIFDRFIGEIRVDGKDTNELSRSIATRLVEVFTELRNYRPRTRLNDKTPADVAKAAKRPEHVRSALESMAERFQPDLIDKEAKWNLIKIAREYFGELSETSIIKLKGIISRYLDSDLIAAQASYVSQHTKNPARSYKSEYFLAILRHKRETLAKQTYNEVYRAGLDLSWKNKLSLPTEINLQAEIALEEFEYLLQDPSPSHQLLRLDTLLWAIVSKNTKNDLRSLWNTIGVLSEKSRLISLKFWQRINEYCMEKIGEIIGNETQEHRDSLAEADFNILKPNLVTHNLSF